MVTINFRILFLTASRRFPFLSLPVSVTCLCNFVSRATVGIQLFNFLNPSLTSIKSPLNYSLKKKDEIAVSSSIVVPHDPFLHSLFGHHRLFVAVTWLLELVFRPWKFSNPSPVKGGLYRVVVWRKYEELCYQQHSEHGIAFSCFFQQKVSHTYESNTCTRNILVSLKILY